MTRFHGFLILLALAAVAGCVSPIDIAVRQYPAAADQIQLGASEADVLPTLEAVQASLKAEERKRPDHYLADGTNVFVYYARSGYYADGLTTDDEFTPYVFHNGRLVAIGWLTLGGPHTQGQVVPETYIQLAPGFNSRY